jgi:hypothetical protein
MRLGNKVDHSNRLLLFKTKGIMTSRERIEAALSHKPPDRTPVFEYVLLSPLADHLLGRRYAGDPANWDDMIKEMGWKRFIHTSAIDQLELALLLGHDMMYVIPHPDPPGLPSKSSSLDEEHFDDPVEAIRRRNERNRSAVPPTDESLLIYFLLKQEMKKHDVDLPLLAPAYNHGVWTDVELMQTMILAPEAAMDHFALATIHSLCLIEKYVALEIDQIGVGGDFAGTKPLISPQAYRHFIVPEVRKLSKRIHKAGRYAINASDGNLWSVMDDFLFECEVDGYLEIDMHAGMDMAGLKKQYGDRITLYGNLDCGNILSFGTPEQVRRHTLSCLQDGMGNGGHVLCASNAITASVPPANYLAVVNAYREMFQLQRFELI